MKFSALAVALLSTAAADSPINDMEPQNENTTVETEYATEIEKIGAHAGARRKLAGHSSCDIVDLNKEMLVSKVSQTVCIQSPF